MIKKNKASFVLLLLLGLVSSCTHLSTAPAGAGQRPQGLHYSAWWTVSSWDLARLDTAREDSSLSAPEKDFILALNMVRSNPPRYAREVLGPLLSFFHNKVIRLPGAAGTVIPGDLSSDWTTREGDLPFRELAALLSTLAPQSLVRPSRGLSLAARDHAVDNARSGLSGHEDSDGSSPLDRERRYGVVVGSGNEVLSYGGLDGFLSLLGLLGDDGVADRGHRRALLSAGITLVGVAIQPHPQWGSQTVAELEQHFFEAADYHGLELERTLDPWRGSTLDTARDADFVDPLDRDKVLLINLARNRPQEFAALVLHTWGKVLFDQGQGRSAQVFFLDRQGHPRLLAFGATRDALARLFPSVATLEPLTVDATLTLAAGMGPPDVFEGSLWLDRLDRQDPSHRQFAPNSLKLVAFSVSRANVERLPELAAESLLATTFQLLLEVNTPNRKILLSPGVNVLGIAPGKLGETAKEIPYKAFLATRPQPR